jgi:hypothetical protein
VATKIDLRESTSEILALKANNQLPVSREKGKEAAVRMKASGYVECSAFYQIGLEETFQRAVDLFLNKKTQRNKSKNCILL